jgi:hypothetical protein
MDRRGRRRGRPGLHASRALARRHYLAVVHDLQWFVPLATVGVATALAAGRLAAGRANAVVWLVALVLLSVGWNFLIYACKLGRGVFGLLLPLVHPTGIDWRVGIFAAGKSFSLAGSGYPPFTLWIGKAFSAVSPTTGYAIQVCLLVGLAVGSAVLCGLLGRAWLWAARESDSGDSVDPIEGDRPGQPFAVWQLGLLGGLWLSTSYGFMFEMERGQLDLYALFFALLAVWLLLARPHGSPWWPSLALALAVNIKAYPGVLAVVLLWRYRWRAVVPLLVTNVALLLSAGPAKVLQFLTTTSHAGKQHVSTRVGQQLCPVAGAHAARGELLAWLALGRVPCRQRSAVDRHARHRYQTRME